MTRVLIGTSGWHYDRWRGPFFPKELPLKKQLEHYSRQFETAELNGVFYRTPSLDAVSRIQLMVPGRKHWIDLPIGPSIGQTIVRPARLGSLMTASSGTSIHSPPRRTR